MADDRKYDDAEVRDIIDRALRTDGGRDLNHEQLVAIGSEVGISREAMERAAREVEASREVTSAETRVVARRRRWFASHAWSYLLVNAFLFAINFLTTPGEWWVLFPVLGWGLALSLHARFALPRHVSERALARERKRMQERRLESGEVRASSARLRIEAERPAPAQELGEADATLGTPPRQSEKH